MHEATVDRNLLPKLLPTGAIVLYLASAATEVSGGGCPRVDLNQIFYGPGDVVTMTVREPSGAADVSSLSKIEVFDKDGNAVDSESNLTFSENGPGSFSSDPLPLSENSKPIADNGILEVREMEHISASYSPEDSTPTVDSRPFRSGQATFWRGIPVFPLGDSSISINANDHLVISNFKSNSTGGAVFYTISPGADVSFMPIELTEDSQAAFASASTADDSSNWLPPNPTMCPPKPGFLGGCSRNAGITTVKMCCHQGNTTRFSVFNGGSLVNEFIVALAPGTTPTTIADVVPITGTPMIISSTAQSILVRTGPIIIEQGVVVQLDRIVSFQNIPGFPGSQPEGDEIRISCPLSTPTNFDHSELTVLVASLSEVTLTDVNSTSDLSPIFSDGFETGDTSMWN